MVVKKTDNKEVLIKKTNSRYRNSSEEEKEVKSKHGRSRYRKMNEKQAKKVLKK